MARTYGAAIDESFNEPNYFQLYRPAVAKPHGNVFDGRRNHQPIQPTVSEQRDIKNSTANNLCAGFTKEKKQEESTTAELGT